MWSLSLYIYAPLVCNEHNKTCGILIPILKNAHRAITSPFFQVAELNKAMEDMKSEHVFALHRKTAELLDDLKNVRLPQISKSASWGAEISCLLLPPRMTLGYMPSMRRVRGFFGLQLLTQLTFSYFIVKEVES